MRGKLHHCALDKPWESEIVFHNSGIFWLDKQTWGVIMKLIIIFN
jgi:hypothetical protein